MTNLPQASLYGFFKKQSCKISYPTLFSKKSLMDNMIFGEILYQKKSKQMEIMTMKKKMTMISLVAVILLGHYAEADSMEKAKELVRLMNMTEQLNAAQQQIGQFAENMVDSQGLSAEYALQAKRMAKASMESTFNTMMEIDWESMFAEIYASVFSEDELQGVIDFYKSPVGKKLLEKHPELMAATMQKMQVEMAKIMPKIQADVAKAIEAAMDAAKNEE